MAKIVGLTFTEAAPAVEPSSGDKFICPHCGKEYKTEDGLKKHIQDKHTDVDGGDNADGNTDPAKEE